MLKDARPSQIFIGAILRAYDKAKQEPKPVTCSSLWDYVCMECFRVPGGFLAMFAWDKSKAKAKNRIHTISECIRRGHVPGLALGRDERGRMIVVEAE